MATLITCDGGCGASESVDLKDRGNALPKNWRRFDWSGLHYEMCAPCYELADAHMKGLLVPPLKEMASAYSQHDKDDKLNRDLLWGRRHALREFMVDYELMPMRKPLSTKVQKKEVKS